MKDETLLAQAGLDFGDKLGSISMPIYQTATFRHPGAGQSTGYDYTRTDNPTRHQIEVEIARLERGVSGAAFSTGMAALTACFFLFKSGDALILSEDLYGGTYRLIEEIFAQLGLKGIYVDTSDLAAVRKAITPAVKALVVETPSNPCMRVSDLAALAELSQKHGLVLIADNTFLTPWLQKPLELGADIVVHSGTKFLAGHNDTLSGFTVAKTAEWGDKLRFIQNSTGAILSPMDSWLIMRGLKTLALRLDRQQENAQKLAEFLQAHPAVETVLYPGLAGHPGKAVNEKQSKGPGAMLSFRVKTPAAALKVIDSVRVVSFAESLGGVESLITYPWTQTHAAIPEAVRLRTGVTETLLRLSVGIEAFEDLRDDLKQALDKAKT